jgi:hypothetical protein
VQVRLALDTKNKGRPSVARDMSRLDGVSTRYRSSLKQWVDLPCIAIAQRHWQCSGVHPALTTALVHYVTWYL